MGEEEPNKRKLVWMNFQKMKGAHEKISEPDLLIKIAEYFDENPKIPTITGLTLHLGFDTRRGFLKYCKKDTAKGTLCRAGKTIIENWNEEQLYNKGVPNKGVQFNLNVNHGRIPESKVQTEDTTKRKPLTEQQTLIIEMLLEGRQKEREKLMKQGKTESPPKTPTSE